MITYASMPAHAQDRSRIRYESLAPIPIRVDFHVNYAYAPTQQDIDETEEIIQAAHRILCDATEGQLGFGKVWLSSGSGGKHRADVWLMPPGLWGRSTNTGFILEDNSHVFLMQGGRSMHTFAHELVHAIFQLRDEYAEQSRWGRYNGFGYAIEPGYCSVTGDRCWTSDGCDVAETCNHSITAPITLTDRINTIMARVLEPQYCSISTTTECVSDYDCQGGANDRCEPHEFYSEFLKADHFDELSGDGVKCPEDLPGETIEVVGLLGASTPSIDENGADPFDATTWADARSTASFHRTVRFIDEDGVVLRNDADSSHDIGVYFKHINRGDRLWQVHFLIDGKHIDPAVPGVEAGKPYLLKSQFIDFNGGSTTYAPMNISAHAAQLCNVSAGFCDLDPVPIPDLFKTGASWSLELDVSNLVLHDGSAWRLRHSEILAEDGRAQRGNCEASDGGGFCNVCEDVYNTATDRWEAASMSIAALRGQAHVHDSEWDQIAAIHLRYPPTFGDDPDGFHGWLTPPIGDPFADPETPCWDPIEIETTVEGTDSFVLVMDVSGSMSNPFTKGGETAPRIQWAKGASRALAELVALHNDTVGADDKQMLGLVSFATAAQERFALQQVDAANLSTVVGAIDNLSANGYTALADGILKAWELIDEATDTPKNPAVVVMTDGYANVCLGEGESCEESLTCECGDPPSADAVAVVETLHNLGINIYFTPLGAEHGQGVFGEAVQQASGEIFPAALERDLAIQYARSYLRFSGVSPIIDGSNWVAGSDSQNPPAYHEFFVEEGAGVLTLLLTARNLAVEGWDPIWAIQTPSSTVYSYDSPGIVDVYDDPSGTYYRILRIEAPEAGTWLLGLSTLSVVQHGALMAWTDSPDPGCHVAAARTVIHDDEEPVEIMVSATHQGALEEVAYTVLVIRPDGSEPVLVAIEPDPETPTRGRGFFPAAEFHGRGQYFIMATCDTSNAWMHPGESLMPDDEALEARRSPAFVRASSTSFFLDVPQHGWLPPGGDCDGNGISDADEGAWCIEGWSSCEGSAVQCVAYGPSTCSTQPGCAWIGWPVNLCHGPPRSCEPHESTQDCEEIDGCNWETPYPCPADPSSIDTNGNGILDACDPDNTGNDVPDPWEPPWCGWELDACSDDGDCCPGFFCADRWGCLWDVSFQGGG